MVNNNIEKVCIVLPTYNEASNIKQILDSIYSNKKKFNDRHDIHVLVVDDNSPDSTSKIVKQYSKKNNKVHLLLRFKKEGLGKAYIDGMNYALTKFKPDLLFEMDADGQHNPKDIYRMIKEIEKGYDFVIGSRYVKGGKTAKGWGMHRVIISTLAGAVTRAGLGIYGIKDMSGGFRAIRSEVLRKINLNSLDVKGYAFQVALLERAVKNHFKITEIPIKFEERKEGKSKMRLSDMMEGWIIIFKIRRNRLFSKPLEQNGSQKVS